LPYVPGLKDVADFLYATTDVAIWSISETGLGITASAAATLRPLFRTFLSRSRLFGGTTKSDTLPWPASRAGYLRSASHAHDQEIGLRSDVGKNSGITTLVDGRSKSADSDEARVAAKEGNDWNTSQSKLTDGSSEDFGSTTWAGPGIKKTTVISTHRT
jgi:hypothetical protein